MRQISHLYWQAKAVRDFYQNLFKCSSTFAYNLFLWCLPANISYLPNSQSFYLFETYSLLPRVPLTLILLTLLIALYSFYYPTVGVLLSVTAKFCNFLDFCVLILNYWLPKNCIFLRTYHWPVKDSGVYCNMQLAF